jgi:hypothetical protein
MIHMLGSFSAKVVCVGTATNIETMSYIMTGSAQHAGATLQGTHVIYATSKGVKMLCILSILNTLSILKTSYGEKRTVSYVPDYKTSAIYGTTG